MDQPRVLPLRTPTVHSKWSRMVMHRNSPSDQWLLIEWMWATRRNEEDEEKQFCRCRSRDGCGVIASLHMGQSWFVVFVLQQCTHCFLVTYHIPWRNLDFVAAIWAQWPHGVLQLKSSKTIFTGHLNLMYVLNVEWCNTWYNLTHTPPINTGCQHVLWYECIAGSHISSSIRCWWHHVPFPVTSWPLHAHSREVMRKQGQEV